MPVLLKIRRRIRPSVLSCQYTRAVDRRAARAEVSTAMCNLYSMTATVDEMRRIFGPFEGDTANLPAYDEIYPGHSAPVLRRKEEAGLKLEMMKWGFPGPAAAGGRPVTNVRNLNSGCWRN